MYLSDKISTCICNQLLKSKIIPNDTYPYYQYSFDFVIEFIIFHSSLIMIGMLLHAPSLALLYVVTLSPVKMLSGGAHAGGRISCSIISYLVFICVILSIQRHIFILKSFTAVILYVINILLILYFTPVDNKNKRISGEMRKHYKKRCFIILSILSLLFVFFICENASKFFSLMTLCVIIILVNQIIGVIINFYGLRKD